MIYKFEINNIFEIDAENYKEAFLKLKKKFFEKDFKINFDLSNNLIKSRKFMNSSILKYIDNQDFDENYIRKYSIDNKLSFSSIGDVISNIQSEYLEYENELIYHCQFYIEPFKSFESCLEDYLHSIAIYDCNKYLIINKIIKKLGYRNLIIKIIEYLENEKKLQPENQKLLEFISKINQYLEEFK